MGGRSCSGNIAQKYKLLHHSPDNKMLPKLDRLSKIIGFLPNTYEKRRGSDGGLNYSTIYEK